MAKDKITKDMTISDILSKHPDTVEIFFKHGMHCLGCAAAQFESLEEAAGAHGIDADALVKDLNEAVGSEKA